MPFKFSIYPGSATRNGGRQDYLHNIRRSKISARLGQAVVNRYDLLENAAHIDAKGEQVSFESEIRRLETILSNTEIIDNTSHPDVVGLAADVINTRNTGQKSPEIFHIVGLAKAQTASLQPALHQRPLSGYLANKDA